MPQSNSCLKDVIQRSTVLIAFMNNHREVWRANEQGFLHQDYILFTWYEQLQNISNGQSFTRDAAP